MNTLQNLLQISVIAALVFISTAADAHKIRVFAYENDGSIVAEAKFSSGRPAKNVEIKVLADNQDTLISGVTDNSGEYRFSTEIIRQNPAGNLTIIVNDGSGHRGTWELEKAEYLGEKTTHLHSSPWKTLHSQENQTNIKTTAVPINYSTIESIVEKTVAREIAPIKQLLTEQKQDTITLQEILGGLGYILGLAGIAAYYSSKTSKK